MFMCARARLCVHACEFMNLCLFYVVHAPRAYSMNNNNHYNKHLNNRNSANPLSNLLINGIVNFHSHMHISKY